MNRKKVTAIVLAAGQGKRMHSDVQKQYMLIGDKPVLYYTLKAFEESGVDEVILVTGADETAYCEETFVRGYGFGKVKAVVAGGKERYDSVMAGLLAAAGCSWVLIHDGARPLVTPALINENISCVKQYGACITAVPAKDTIKTADENGFVEGTPDRSRLWQVQTPQSFGYDLILEAHEKRIAAADALITDDAMLVEKYMNHPVRLLMGDYRNIKITTPEDMVIAGAFLGI